MRWTDPSSSGLILLLEQGIEQVAQLLRSETVAFNVGRESSLAINNGGMKRVHQQRLIRIEVHIELSCHLLNLRQGTGEEVPAVRIRFPDVSIVGQSFRSVVCRIDNYTQQHKIFSHLLLEALLQLPKIIGQAKTVIRKRAT